MSPSLRLVLLCLLAGLLLPSDRLATGAPVNSELRCQCVNTVQGVSPKTIASLKVIPASASCANLEVIVTLKKGNKLCLNPEAPGVKKILEKVMKGSN